MTAPRAWVLNLDAEDELASPATHRDPFAALAARPHLRDALADLVGLDLVLARGQRAPGAMGRTFSPTPSALAALRAAGAAVPVAPDVSVLRRVADRRFGLGLGSGHVPGAVAIEHGDDLRALIASIPGPRVLKRIFGFAGRGRHLCRGGAPTLAERGFVDRALRADGAVVIEPWLPRTLDLGIHGFLATDAAAVVAVGDVTVQVVTPHGAWRGTRRAGAEEVTVEERARLEAQVHTTGAALAAAGYFGPFGIDAFRYDTPDGGGLVTRCEVNARYTMGWAVGMGPRRPDL